jgi:hypothetical protein
MGLLSIATITVFALLLVICFMLARVFYSEVKSTPKSIIQGSLICPLCNGKVFEIDVSQGDDSISWIRAVCPNHHTQQAGAFLSSCFRWFT